MPASEVVDRIVRMVMSLRRDEVVDVGVMLAPVAAHWIHLASSRIVLTWERKNHVFGKHPEMSDLAVESVLTLDDPDEIHWDKNEPATTVTLWRKLDSEGLYWTRVTVRLAIAGQTEELHNSVITAWRTRRRGYLAEVKTGRRVWMKEES